MTMTIKAILHNIPLIPYLRYYLLHKIEYIYVYIIYVVYFLLQGTSLSLHVGTIVTFLSNKLCLKAKNCTFVGVAFGRRWDEVLVYK
jgi:hypothetical protein